MRRLRALVRNLPPESALWRSGVVPAGARWSVTQDLLAGIAELVDFANRLFYGAHAKPGSPQPPPLSIERPGEARARPTLQPADLPRALGTPAYYRPGRQA